MSDPIGAAIMELLDLNDINDHISMRVILGRLVQSEREACAQRTYAAMQQVIDAIRLGTP